MERTKKDPSLKGEMMCVNGEPYGSENDNNKIDILCFVRKLKLPQAARAASRMNREQSLLLRLRAAVRVTGMSQHVTAELSHTEH